MKLASLAAAEPVLRTATHRPAPIVRRREQPFLARLLMHLSPVTWAVFDLSLIALATILAYRVLGFHESGYGWIASPWITGAAFCGGIVIAGLVFGLYEHQTLLQRSRTLVRFALTASLGAAIALACTAGFFYAEISRWLGLSIVGLYAVVALPLRLWAHHVITTSRVRVLCIGNGESIRKVAALLGNGHRRHYQVMGHVRAPRSYSQRLGPVRQRTSAGGADPRSLERACPYLGTLEELNRILESSPVDEVIVDAALRSDPAVGEAVMTCLERHCRVTDQPTFVEKLLGEVPVEDINADWFLAADVQAGATYQAVKRALDVAAALAGLALTLPVWPLIALLIWLDSRGPVFYRQARVGLHGRGFSIYKFRTMRVDAESGGVRWAAPNDARVTRLGRLLRQSRLDELPQLWNILRGEMSLVGPRPERPEFVDQLARVIPNYRQRHLVKPGLTGWAQVHYGYGASIDDARRKLCFDLYYLKHRSIDMDVAILIRTVGTFLLGAR